MKKLMYTDNIGFDMNDWEHELIKKVFAGVGCIMAITEDGRTLQKISDQTCSASVKYWTRINSISLSEWFPGLAIGLVSDGTCLIAKKPLRKLIDVQESHEQIPFDIVNQRIKSWKNIIQTAVSDAYFAVDSDGRVFYAATNKYTEKDYYEVCLWRNVCRIVVGLSNSVIGITKDGRMMCAGANLRQGPHGDISKKISSYTDVVDVCLSGSECESIMIAHDDGMVEEINLGILPVKSLQSKEKVLYSHYGYFHYILDSERHLLTEECKKLYPTFPSNPVIDSVAIGDHGYPFVIALTEI